MATLTVFAATTTAGGYIQSLAFTYATARSGTSLSATTGGTTSRAGQYFESADGSYGCYEDFLSFDTSSIGDTDTINQADLSLWLASDSSTTDFTLEARVDDYGATLTTADWVAGASLTGFTRVATRATSGIGATGAYKAFTEDGTAFRSAINKTGFTRLILASDRMAAGTTPTTFEFLDYTDTGGAGTTQDPKLFVTYSADQSLAAGFIASGSVLYGARIDRTLRAGFISSGSVTYGAMLGQGLNAGFIASGSVTYGPTLSVTVAAGFIPSGSTAYGAKFNVEVAAGFISSGSQTFGASFTLAYSLAAGFIAAGSVTYGASYTIELTYPFCVTATVEATHTGTITVVAMATGAAIAEATFTATVEVIRVPWGTASVEAVATGTATIETCD